MSTEPHLPSADSASAQPPTGDVTTAQVPEPIGSLNRSEIAHLARLARLDLSTDELDLYGRQLSVILDSVAVVTQVADPVTMAAIVPTTHAVPLTNVFRADVVVPGLGRDVVLAGAPAAQDDRFRVPQILGEEQ